jgi:hypothetical protein
MMEAANTSETSVNFYQATELSLMYVFLILSVLILPTTALRRNWPTSVEMWHKEEVFKIYVSCEHIFDTLWLMLQL